MTAFKYYTYSSIAYRQTDYYIPSFYFQLFLAVYAIESNVCSFPANRVSTKVPANDTLQRSLNFNSLFLIR